MLYSEYYYKIRNIKNIIIIDKTNSAVLSEQKSDNISDFVDFALPRNYNIIRNMVGRAYMLESLFLYVFRAGDMTVQQGVESNCGTSNAAINKNNRTNIALNGNLIRFDTPDECDKAILNTYSRNRNYIRALLKQTSYDYYHELQYPRKYEKAYEETTKYTDEYYNRMIAHRLLYDAVKSYIKANYKNIIRNWG